MATGKNSVTYDSIMRDLKAGKFAPVYVLMGDESYYIDKICDYIMANALTEAERDFNLSVVYGIDVTEKDVLDEARAYPMMAKRRVVVVKESQAMKGVGERMAKYFAKPVPSTILVFCHKNGKIDGRKAYMKNLSSQIVVFESKRVTEYQLRNFVSQYVKTKKATIDEKATQMMVDHVGSDLHRMTSELDKILISMPDNDRRITPEIVEREVGVSKDFNLYELRDAIASKQVFKANQIIDYFDKNNPKGAAIIILSSLFKFFQELMISYYTPGIKTQDNVARYLELNQSWQAKPYLMAMRNYSGVKVMQILEKIMDTDLKIKGVGNTSTSSGDLLKELLFFILH